MRIKQLEPLRMAASPLFAGKLLINGCKENNLKRNKRIRTFFMALLLLAITGYAANHEARSASPPNVDPLPSWNAGAAKTAIINFVQTVVDRTSPNYVSPESRVAAFDNDGTLCPERPTYFQIEFTLNRIKLLAKEHAEWQKDKLIQAAIKQDLVTLREKYSVKGLGKLMALTHADITTDEFELVVRNWIKTAKHPSTGRLYGEMVFQPMLELIHYLQNNHFKVYIVSAAGVDFMRVWAEEAYGMARENILGSMTKLKYEKIEGRPVLMKSNEIVFVNDGKGKPVAIHRLIGRKPLLSFGNSDGDLEMLEWCAANKHKSLPAYIHHTDAEREWAYDRDSRIGKLSKGLDEATEKGWLVVDMKKDWKTIYPFEMTKPAAGR
jgi:hypothetical protein